MYLVTMYNGANDAQSTTIHSSRSGVIKLVDGIINQEVNKIPSFSFGFLPDNPAFGNILPYKTTFEVFNMATGQYEFIGRATRPDESMDEDLTFATEWEAEGELGYLKDSVQPHFEFRGTVEQAFIMQIENHNRMVEDFKRFEVGVVEVTDPNDYLYFYLMQTENTLDSIQRTLINKLGGELRIRHENGIRYLDYVLIDGDVGNAEILIKKNLLSVSKSVDVTDTITRLVPLGNRIESEDEQATDASQKRLTIASVNDGKDYIDSDDLIGYYTIRMGAKVWDDINTPQALMTSGSNWLENQSDILAQYEVKAIDLGIKDPTLDPYICGWFYRLYNPYMRIDEFLRIVKKQIDINSPQNDKIMIGDIIKSATEIDQELRSQNQMAYSMLELERTKLEREVKAVTLTAQTIQEENKDLKEKVIPQMNNSYNDLNKSYKDVLERLKKLETAVPPTEPEPVKNSVVNFTIVKKEPEQPEPTDPEPTEPTGKNIVMLGDSITMGYGRTTKIPDVVKQALSAQLVQNAGYGSTTAALHPTKPELRKIGFTKLVDSIVSGNWSEALNADLSGITYATVATYKQSLTDLSNINFNEVDSVIIMYGTNDWAMDVKLDNSGNQYDQSTYLGALRYGINKLKQAYPHLDILVAQPILWTMGSMTSETYGNSIGLKVRDYANALNNSLNMSVPIAQIYNKGITTSNYTNYFNTGDSSDGTHPNSAGNAIIGELIASEFTP